MWLIVPIVVLFAIGSAAIGPLIMHAIMTTRPLDEALRQRLLEQCAEQGMRVREARMLDSRGGRVANAAISGILPGLRYMYLGVLALVFGLPAVFVIALFLQQHPGMEQRIQRLNERAGTDRDAADAPSGTT